MILRLRADGHIVESVAEQFSGSEDLPVLARAVESGLPLLTRDRDFGDYIFRDHQPAPAEGVILHRLSSNIPTPRKADIISDAFKMYADQFAHHFAVIDEDKVRFRPLPTAGAQPTAH